MLGWMTALVRGLWGFSRASWIDVGNGLRPGSGASALYIFLFLIFCIIGFALLTLGFDLDRVDEWLDRHGNWFDLAGTMAFKALLAFILLVSVVVGTAGLYGRICALARLVRRSPPEGAAPSRRSRGSGEEGDAYGWGAILFALIAGYFSAVGLFN